LRIGRDVVRCPETFVATGIFTERAGVLMELERFVVQEHRTGEGVHWDLMLEAGEVLATFRLAERPEAALGRPVEAVKILDHPLRFLTYEGPVQKGTGQVRIVERGTYRLDDRKEERWVLTLRGEILQGVFALVRTQGDAWQFSPEEPENRP
jgi:bifunctional non-homologous end joining protein LigD